MLLTPFMEIGVALLLIVVFAPGAIMTLPGVTPEEILRSSISAAETAVRLSTPFVTAAVTLAGVQRDSRPSTPSRADRQCLREDVEWNRDRMAGSCVGLVAGATCVAPNHSGPFQKPDIAISIF